MKKYLALFTAVLMLITCTTSCSGQPAEQSQGSQQQEQQETDGFAAEPELILRFSENDSTGESVDYANNFADMVYERTNGRIKIEVFPGGQLGNFTEVVQGTNMGAIDFARCAVTHMSDIGIHDGSLNVFGLPFLYSSDEHIWKIARSDIAQEYIYDVIDNSGQNVICLDLVPGPIRNLYTTDAPITKMSDFQGKKIRVQSNEIYVDFINALGASPTPLATDEVYGALQTGVVDGSEAAIKAFVNLNYYEVCPYFTYTRHMAEMGMIIANKTMWNKLSAEDQQIMYECAREAGDTFKEACANNVAANIQKCEEAGVTFYEFEEPDKLVEAMAPVYEKYGSGYEDLIASIQNYE